MKKNGKRWAAVVAASVLSVGMAVMPMQAMAASETVFTMGEAETVMVLTTQQCSIWGEPATMEENRIKYVDEAYCIQVYPVVVESVLGDGKTFYRTIRGAYVLCRCVVGEDGNPLVPDETQEPTTEVAVPSNSSVPDSWYQAVGRTDVTFGRPDQYNEIHVYNSDGSEAGVLILREDNNQPAGFIRTATEEENLAAIERQKEFISTETPECILDENGNCIATDHTHDGDF